MSMKVLHLLWDGNLGGVQRYILKVIGAPFWDEVEHAICFFSSGGEVIQHSGLTNISFHSLNLKSGWQLGKARRELKRVIKDVQPDVIHCHCDTPVFSLQMNRFEGIRLVYTEHGDTIMRQDRVWLLKCLWRYSGKKWDSIIANSHFVRADFIKRFPFLSETTTVLHNPLIEQWNGSRSEVESGRLHIGIFARLVWQKGIDRGLEVMTHVVTEVPNALLHIYGTGPLEVELKRTVAQLGLSDNVVFNGYTDSPLSCMAAMDCTLVPSRIEPFGLVALEAQSTGTPVVGFRQSGVGEVIIDEETGLLVNQGDLRAMAKAICSIITNKDKQSSMGDAAQRRATQVFSLESHIQSLQSIYCGS